MIYGQKTIKRSLLPKTKQREIDRKMTVGLYLLRITKCGLSISDLNLLSVGLVNDMFIESLNDSYDYPYIATQEDIDRL